MTEDAGTSSGSGTIPPLVPTVLPALNPNLKRLLCEDELNELHELNEAKKLKSSDDAPPLPPLNPGNGNRKIYIGNLPASVTEKPLVAYFRAFGHVTDCTVVRDKELGISRGFAFLTFLDESEADAAVDLENHKLDGKPIRVSFAQKNASSIPRASKKVLD